MTDQQRQIIACFSVIIAVMMTSYFCDWHWQGRVGDPSFLNTPFVSITPRRETPSETVDFFCGIVVPIGLLAVGCWFYPWKDQKMQD